MRIIRRDFLKAAGAASVVSLGAAPTGFLRRLAAAEQKASTSGRVLVLVELAGGNDGLNTVIPFRDPEYQRARPGIGINTGAVRKLNDDLGLHPAMEDLETLFKDGAMTLVQGVGYPKPDRSHFRSMDIWHSAVPEKVAVDTGWIGRLGDSMDLQPGHAPSLAVGTDRLPLALTGAEVVPPAIRSASDYRLELQGPSQDRKQRQALLRALATSPVAAKATPPAADELAFLRSASETTWTSVSRLREVVDRGNEAKYPSNGLGESLKLIAQLIAADFGPEVYYTQLGGFDTHSRQQPAHARLLGELSQSLGAFFKDLSNRHLVDRVLVATYSEFGRRVKENGSLGTDHGAASQMMLLSPALAGGVVGKHPSLTDLDDGDLKFHTDFRSVYATLLEDWLGRPSAPILGQEFPKISLL